MAQWRDDKILELASQLTYSPADKRAEQLTAAMELLSSIHPGTTYPWDFVHFRITSFQPRTHIDHVVAGKILRADLATLIEFLSDTLSITVEDATKNGDSVLSLEEVSAKFSVSSKTIQRWRKQGLIALRYVYSDGRRRLGFLESAAGQFAAANKERVEKSANFSQLSDDERVTIIALAKKLVGLKNGVVGIKDVALAIGKQLNRSPEAIRYTIRKYDADHAECPVFPDITPPSSYRIPAAQSPIHAEVSPPKATQSSFHLVTRERAAQFKMLVIEFIPNPLFDHPDADNIILNVLPREAMAAAHVTVTAGTNAAAHDPYMARTPENLPAFLQDIFRQPVMPIELETDAFRRMNYMKYKAARLQKKLDAEHASPTELAEIEILLVQANDIKNQLLQSNLRVAAHVARKHQRADRPLIELVSDATIWLMRAVEKFDFARGNTQKTRFTTYASFALMKNFARNRAEQLTRRDAKTLTGQEEVLNTVGSRESAPMPDQIDDANLQSDLAQVIQELPDRERELLTTHYGLDQGKPALSLSEIGTKMGITKSRVRQLEARALRKLRKLLETRREKLRP